MREKQLEQKLVKAAKAEGGMAVKVVSPGLVGMPDRMVLLPGGRIAFVEVKAPGMKPRTVQQKRHEQLRRLGFLVHILDDAGQIQALLSAIKEGDAL